ncbi:MAG: HypC/HybG/HupF family hydrogenase formation chaperone [Thermoprotei archaeon]|nr:MAG: HypC/HybG/HupF family hydrogenase formation chaperone [Thermoprotei archaeon]
MCLGVPARVVEVRGETALVDCGGYVREVDAILLPDVRVGDYVIIHAGAIIARIDEKEAIELIKLWREVARAASSPD